MHLFFLWHSDVSQICNFSKLSYNYFHPQKRSFVYHSQKRLCVKRTYNVHTIYTQNIGVPKHKKTRNNFLVQVRNLLLPLSLKVLRHKERDTHSFYSGFFICPTPYLLQRPQRTNLSDLSEPRKSTLPVRCPVLNSTDFFKIPQILRALPVRDVTRTFQSRFPSGLL